MNLSKLRDILKRVKGEAKEDVEKAHQFKVERDELRRTRRTTRKRVQEETDTAVDDMTQTTFDLTAPKPNGTAKAPEPDEAEPAS